MRNTRWDVGLRVVFCFFLFLLLLFPSEDSQTDTSTQSVDSGRADVVKKVKKVPLACKEDLDKFKKILDGTKDSGLGVSIAAALGSCSSLFPACDVPQADSKVFRIQTVDNLIRQVVGVRINNLYKGINSSLATPKVNDPEKWETRPCNLYCGEGYPDPELNHDRWGKFTLPSDLGDSPEGRMKDRSKYSTLYSKKFSTNWPEDGSGEMDKVVEKVKPDSSYLISHGVVVGGGTRRCGNGPTFKHEGGGGYLGDNCYNSPHDDEDKVINYMEAGDDSISTMTWDDFGLDAKDRKNDGECDEVISIDYSDATIIEAMHLGVLVQLLWVKLEEVIGEIRNGYIAFSGNDPCMPLGESYFVELAKSLAAFVDNDACKTEAKAELCKPAADGSVEGETRECQIKSLVSTMGGLSLLKVAECEVYQRANSQYSNLMIEGVDWLRQVRNWAVVGCAGDPTDQPENDLEKAGNAILGGIVSIFSSSAAKVIQKSKHQWLAEFMEKCFIYKYSLGLKAYLDRNGVKLTEFQKNGGVISGGTIATQRVKDNVRYCQIPSASLGASP